MVLHAGHGEHGGAKRWHANAINSRMQVPESYYPDLSLAVILSVRVPTANRTV
jgi:hypothetical protein